MTINATDLQDFVGKKLWVNKGSISENYQIEILEISLTNKGWLAKVPNGILPGNQTLVPLTELFLTKQDALLNLKEKILKEIEILNTPAEPEPEHKAESLWTKLQCLIRRGEPN